MTVDHLKLLHAMGGKGETSEVAAFKTVHLVAFSGDTKKALEIMLEVMLEIYIYFPSECRQI